MNYSKPLLLTLVVLFLLSAGALPDYYLSLTTTALIWSILAMSLNLLLGYTGLLCLGQGSFFGLAAYVIAILSIKAGVPGISPFFLAILSGGLFAAVMGPLVLRAKQVYFMLITMAIAELLWGLAFKWRSLTGGDDGMPGLSRPNLPILGDILQGPVGFYYFVLFWFGVAALFLYLHLRSPVGKIFVGIRENELRMKVLGHNVWLYRYVSYILGGLVGGLAGALQVYHAQFVSPSDLSTVVSAEVLLMVILGGAGTFLGPLIGAFGVVFLENILSGWTERWAMILGAIYIVVVILTPKGLMGVIGQWRPKR